MKNKNKKEEIKNKKEDKKIHKKFWKIILFIIIFFITIFVIGTLKLEKIVSNIVNYQNSIIVDTEGNTIAILGNERKQETITLDKIPKNLINAYISIEDKRYYSHHGVDIRRTGGAIINYVKNLGKASFGGSSITQQFIKNISGDDENNITRKIQEWFRAWQTEIFMNKDQILEAYLNIIYVGPNIYGVNLGSKYYFNKDISQMTLAECAYLAGLNHSPNSYNPFREGVNNSEKIKKRTKTVLTEMKNQGYIQEDEYNQAITEVDTGLNFQKGQIEAKGNGIYSYHTDALINQLIEDFSKKKNISENFAKNYIYLSGFKIYSTQNSDVQKEIEQECLKKNYILKSQKNPNATTQAAIVIIDHKTGEVLGCSGGLGEKTTARGLNRAIQTTRQTGSAGKPIAVLAPALAKNLITPSTIYADEPTTFDDGEGGYTPTDYNGYKGNITVRRAVESSQNIPFVKIMEQLTPRESINFMENMGITTLTNVDNNINLALGGLDKGISPLEMAGAYATIANDGFYIKPTFYKKVENKDGENILEVTKKTKKVFSAEIAYILKDLLKQPVIGKYGTASYCKIGDMDVAAKTGTTNENYDRWLCGFTNYYTTVVWYGYDLNETIHYKGNNPAGVIWSKIMKRLHTNLETSNFVKPEGVSKLAVCSQTGMIATFNCKNTYTECFLNTNIPPNCTQHNVP
ncbi:MAG: penicillin-binding protein [Clostridia bacterium]|nr:penicillin-binding protein [Clostridia bacterium]